MKAFEDWPIIMDAPAIQECIDVSRSDAQAILKRGPVIDPGKKRNRTIGKGPLRNFLEGESA